MRKRLGSVAILGCCALIAACGSSSKTSSASTTAARSTETTAAPSAETTAAPAAETTAAAPEFPPIPDGPIKLGISLPLSGQYAVQGLTAQKAYDNVTMKVFNAAHPDGIDGHPVELVLLDDASDVSKAIAVANQMVADKLAGVIAATSFTIATPQQIAIFNKAKMPLVTAQATDAEYEDTVKWPYMFGVGASYPQMGKAAADWIAKHTEIKTVGVLTDGTPTQQNILKTVVDPLKTSAPNVKVLDEVTIASGATVVSTQVAQLKASNPDLLIVLLGTGYGPVWQAIQSAGWSPRIMSIVQSWYDGFDAMGPLAENGVVFYNNCETETHPPFPKELTDAMDGFADLFGPGIPNYLTFVAADNLPIEIFKLAIEKYHSIDPDAIKKAIEGMSDASVYGTFNYKFSPTNHFGLTGAVGANVCKMTPFGDGKYNIPVIAP